MAPKAQQKSEKDISKKQTPKDTPFTSESESKSLSETDLSFFVVSFNEQHIPLLTRNKAK